MTKRRTRLTRLTGWIPGRGANGPRGCHIDPRLVVSPFANLRNCGSRGWMGLPPWDQRGVRQSWWQGIRGPEPAGVLAARPAAWLPQLAWQGTDQRGPIAIAMKAGDPAARCRSDL